MALLINVYKTSSYLDAYSQAQSQTDPVFNFPPIDWDGDAGQSRDVELFMRNDGTLVARSVIITPTDISGTDETGWVKLSTTQGGLAGATPGATLIPPDLNPNDTYIFWERITVPAATSVQRKIDLTLRITANGHAV